MNFRSFCPRARGTAPPSPDVEETRAGRFEGPSVEMGRSRTAATPGSAGRPRRAPPRDYISQQALGCRAPQLTHFPARHGLGRPPRPSGCSLLTGVWAGSGGRRRRRCWLPPLPQLLGAWAALWVSAAAMDEQAGPGVFFSNNHPGAGGAKGLGPLAEAAAAGDGAASAGAARAQYSLPGILHFLQHEWARFEVERAQWEVERAELQVKTLPARPSSSRLFAPFRPAPDPSPPPPVLSRPLPLCSRPSHPEPHPLLPFTFGFR